MTLDRRAFLSIVAGSPFVFGLSEIFAQDPAPVPEWYKAALKRMKDTGRYGIAIVVPDDEKERERWGKALIARYNEFASDRHEPFGLAVMICLTSKQAENLLKHDFKDPKAVFVPNRFLLRPDGRVESWTRVEIATLENPQVFEFSFSTLAYGLNNDRLAEQVKAIEKTLPEALRKAAADLSEVDKYPAEAANALLEKADAILPWIAFKCRMVEAKLADADGKLQGQVGLRKLLVSYWTRHSQFEADPCLPFGAKVEALPQEDPCPPCGMAVITTGRARRFLSFFEK